MIKKDSEQDNVYIILSIELVGDSLPIDTIESILGIKTGEKCEKGTHPKNNPKYTKYKTNIWTSELYKSKTQGSVFEIMNNICNKFAKNKNEIIKLMSSDKIKGFIKISMTIPITFGWEEITPEQMRLLGALGFSLWLGSAG